MRRPLRTRGEGKGSMRAMRCTRDTVCREDGDRHGNGGAGGRGFFAPHFMDEKSQCSVKNSQPLINIKCRCTALETHTHTQKAMCLVCVRVRVLCVSLCVCVCVCVCVCAKTLT